MARFDEIKRHWTAFDSVMVIVGALILLLMLVSTIFGYYADCYRSSAATQQQQLKTGRN